jgi:hypothetical protein
MREEVAMSDKSIELNDNTAAHHDDRTSLASAVRDEIEAQPRRARAAGGRFHPGQSGNPNGRPRKAPEPFHAMAARVLNEKVQITLGGQRVEMACAEAIFRGMCHGAMKDPRMGKEVFKYIAAQEARIDPGETDARLAQGEAAFDNYCARLRRQILAELASAAAASASDNDNLGHAVESEDAS